jgi:DNA ligase-1
VLLADVVAASREVAETGARSAKLATLAALLRRLERDEVPVVAGLLSGVPRQGRIGVGYAGAYGATGAAGEEAVLTVRDLDRVLSEIQEMTGAGSAAARRRLLDDLFARATDEEGAFVRRLLTGELRQGALAGIMVDAVARAAGVPLEVTRKALMLSGDLPRTAAVALAQGEAGLRAIGFELFRPVLPMLASTAESVADAVASFELSSVEWKLDGIRIQVHRRAEEVAIYTRNLNDITESLPGIVATVRALPVSQAVLDGEALSTAFLFDLLHVDGEDLLDLPLRERSARLEAIAPGLKIPGIFTADAAEAERVLDEALDAGHEGVVVKDAASPYAAGRRGKAWRKVKPVRTYDLVVLGAEWGHGRRQGRLSNLHLGARDPRTGEFVMVGKTFKGMTDELLAWQTQQLLERKVEQRGIAVLVRPELVVEIALDGVQASTRYPGGIALRFARVKRYRPDKDAAASDTIDDLRALLPGAGGRK